MIKIYTQLKKSIDHLNSLNDVFLIKENYENELDYKKFNTSIEKLDEYLEELKIHEELYNQKDRQMILADLIEYIFSGRGIYAIRSRKGSEDLGLYIKILMNLNDQ